MVAPPNLTADMRKKLEPIVKLRQEIGRIDTEIEGLKRQQIELDQRANETRTEPRGDQEGSRRRLAASQAQQAAG